jgi:hypothetical protein
VNWQPNETGAEEGMTGVIEPALEGRTATAADPAGDWLCVWCLSRVAHEKDRFRYEGQDEFTFSNPAGLQFEIITFIDAPGCHQTGTPTLEHTWFPSHAWSFCQCDECGQHLGWFYAGTHKFVGLIKNRIVRGLYVRN